MTTQEREKFDYSTFAKKRFNIKKANSIVIETLENTSYNPKQHKDLFTECRFNVYQEFGWTKSSTKYVNNKLITTMLDSGLIFKYKNF